MLLGAAALSSPSNTAECLVSLFTTINTRMLNHHFVQAWSDSGLLRFFSDFSSDPLPSDFPDGGDMLTCSSAATSLEVSSDADPVPSLLQGTTYLAFLP
jgi:hypothetical protein